MKAPRARGRKPEAVDLQLQTTSPDDRTLPRPRGRALRRRTVDWKEFRKLGTTKVFGGLLPEGSDAQAWQCVSCFAIYYTQAKAVKCCQKSANRVQLCRCCKRRLIDCICPPISTQSQEGGAR
jgi:hypothetical protein